MTDLAAEPIVIVGAGIAGVRVVEGARQAGYTGNVVLIGDEPHEPYDRPPLSKDVLLREGHENAIALIPGGDLFKDVELKIGAPAVSIDREACAVTLSTGEAVRYGKLVLATGSRLRILPALPRGAPGVHYVRGLDDALALRAALLPGTRVAIVGAGVIGLEIAAAAQIRGARVAVIEAQNRSMSRTASPVISEFLERRHRAEGVDFRFGTTVQSVDRTNGLQLHLSDGAVLDADLVVVGVGVAPNAELARACGLEVRGDAIVVDEHGRTSDPRIFAAGEATLHYNARHARHDRQETWAHAAAHGDHVGRCLVAPQEPYAELSSYWSDQYDINLQVFGTPAGEVDVVRGDPESGKFLVFHISQRAIVGVSAVNSVRELRAAKKLIGRPAPEDLGLLADASAPLTAMT